VKAANLATFEGTGRFVRAGGLNLHYHDVNPTGTGLPLVGLHGTGPGASAWSNFRHNVDAFAGRFRTILLDLPQYGKSDKPVITDGRQTYTARILKEFLDELGLPRANFVGNSMGGQIALKLAIDNPSYVNRLVLIGSSPTKTTLAPWPVEAIRLIRAYYSDGGPTVQKMRALMETMVYDQKLITDELVRERFEASVEPDTMALFTSAPAAVQEDFGSQLEQVKAKTLLVWGQEDRAGALEVALFMLKRLTDAELHVFGKVGHWVQVERADEFNRLVLDFFSA
jgi:4,5:9,10-diseco-3-hydroxy-5,9,17-trioxoandrosta-1(10),2-diene-4-oate hydrolase